MSLIFHFPCFSGLFGHIYTQMKATFIFDLKFADHLVDNWWRKEAHWPDTSI